MTTVYGWLSHSDYAIYAIKTCNETTLLGRFVGPFGRAREFTDLCIYVRERKTTKPYDDHTPL